MDIKKAKVLVTGGAGFLGAHVARRLILEGAEVTILDLCIDEKRANISDIMDKVKLYNGDINDIFVVREALQGMNVVVHCAFPVYMCDRSLENQYISSGTTGLFNVLREALAQRSLTIYASSISVYGRQLYTPIDENHPLNPVLLYGVTKLAGEYYCLVMAREYGLKVDILRFSDLYGPGLGRSNAPVLFISRGLKGLPITIKGGGRQVRSYLYISDAAQAVLLSIKNSFGNGTIYNVAGREQVNVTDLALLANEVTGSNSLITYEEGWLDDRDYRIDFSKARTNLGFSPEVDLRTGMKHIMDWIKKNGW